MRQAVILSADGLAVGSSKGLSREDAEHLSAVAAGFQSLARGAGRHFGGGEVRQTIVEMESAFLFVTAAGQGACLAVLADADADVGLVAYEMAMLVKRVGQHLSTNPRARSSCDERNRTRVAGRATPGRSSGPTPSPAAGPGPPVTTLDLIAMRHRDRRRPVRRARPRTRSTERILALAADRDLGGRPRRRPRPAARRGPRAPRRSAGPQASSR